MNETESPADRDDDLAAALADASGHGASAANPEADAMAAEWEAMLGGGDDDGGGGGMGRESTRVLNQDEIDSLLGFDEAQPRDQPPFDRPYTKWEEWENVRLAFTLRPLGWRTYKLWAGLLDHGTYGFRLGPISITLYLPWNDPSVGWD